MDSCHHPLLFLHPSTGCGDICANGGLRGCSTRRSAGTMGHGPFHCIAPSVTSLVHKAAVFMVIDTLAASLSVVLPTQPTTAHIG